MNDETLKRLDLLAQRLNTTAANLWQVLVRQARIEGIMDIISIVLFSLLLALCIKYAAWALKKDRQVRTEKRKEGSEWERWENSGYCRTSDACFMWVVVAVVVGAISLGIVLFCLFELPTVLLNPDFYALQQIMGMVTGK